MLERQPAGKHRLAFGGWHQFEQDSAAYAGGARQIGDDANLAFEADHTSQLAIDVFEPIAEEGDLLALLERLDTQTGEFDIVGAKTPIIPHSDRSDQNRDRQGDASLFDPELRNRKLNGSRMSISNPDERIRIHRLSIRFRQFAEVFDPLPARLDR